MADLHNLDELYQWVELQADLLGNATLAQLQNLNLDIHQRMDTNDQDASAQFLAMITLGMIEIRRRYLMAIQPHVEIPKAFKDLFGSGSS